MPRKIIPLMDRLWAKVVKTPQGCWEFTGAKTGRSADKNKQYGHIRLGKRGSPMKRVHVIVYENLKGHIPPGYMVCHKCDNPSCCNPDHLFIGTMKDNINDMIKKGRKHKTYGGGLGLRLSTSQVNEIRSDNRSLSIIAEEYGVVKATISNIKNYKTRKVK